MKFKERLWQLFLAIVLGVTLSVCDAGLQDDELENSALIAGSAIAAGVTSGDGYVKIGDFIINYGNFNLSQSSHTLNFSKQHSLIPLLLSKCISEQYGTSEGNVTNVTASSFSISENSGCSSQNNSSKINWVSLGQ